MQQIFVHGLGQTPACWDRTILALDGSEPPLCPDLAGLVRGREASYDNLYRAFSRLCGSMITLDFSHSLTEITCPVLIACGKKDAANQKAAEALTGLLKNAELRMVEGAGHEVNVDAPEALAELLRGLYA